MIKNYSSRAELTTGLILAGLSITLTGCLLFWYFGDPQQFVSHRLGFHSHPFDRPIIWILTFLIAIGYILYTSWAVPIVRHHLFTISWLKVIGIWAAFVSSIVEEIIFRQVLMDSLRSLDISTILQVFASAAVFGVAHGFWVLLKGEFKIALPIILSTTILGGLLAVLYIIADRNVLAPIVAHILINFFIEPWLMLAAVSGKWDSEEKN